MDYRIFPPEEILETTVSLPVSKSMAVRDIMLSYFSGNVGKASALADACDDTHILYSLLDAGLPSDGSRVDVGAAGTAMRFLTAAVAATDGAHCLITGTERMCRRPIGVLVDALRSLGADIEYRGEEGFPPLEIKGRRLKGGSVDVETGVSSQFLSALMMAGPLMEEPLTIVAAVYQYDRSYDASLWRRRRSRQRQSCCSGRKICLCRSYDGTRLECCGILV